MTDDEKLAWTKAMMEDERRKRQILFEKTRARRAEIEAWLDMAGRALREISQTVNPRAGSDLYRRLTRATSGILRMRRDMGLKAQTDRSAPQDPAQLAASAAEVAEIFRKIGLTNQLPVSLWVQSAKEDLADPKKTRADKAIRLRVLDLIEAMVQGSSLSGWSV